MHFGMELNQNQSLKLALTPELRQSINILQYSSIELIEFLQEQAVENPLLEVKEQSINEFFSTSRIPSSFEANQGYDPINHYSNTNTSLERHLMEQMITLPNLSSNEWEILEYLIGHLNSYGYLEIDPIVTIKELSVSLEELENSISILQTLDPVGVGARNLQESLLLQLKDSSSYPLAYKIIEEHLEDMADKRYQRIAKIHDVTVQEVQEAADFIKTLNPRPCTEFNHEMTQYIVPDIIVEYIKGEFIIIINDRLIPQLTINKHLKYNNDLTDDYIKKKQHEATMLINGISQRKYTLYKVTKAIIDMQEDFLQFGMSKLKPMTLYDISEKLGFHESTISRATSNKYIQTPQGVYKLKNLFTTGISKNNSLEVESSLAIKEKIRDIIDQEDKHKPLSDQLMVKILQKEGIVISRRTVAKYREEMGILSSSKRKRY